MSGRKQGDVPSHESTDGPVSGQRVPSQDAASVWDDRPAPTLPEGPPPAPDLGTPPASLNGATATPPSGPTWYRSERERAQSVYRRANPWYRRLARMIVGAALLAALGAGVYVGATALRSYLSRDRLPAAGATPPVYRWTSLLVTSSAPAPALSGTLTIDVTSGAFEFAGTQNGPQAGLEFVSADGDTVFVRENGGNWRLVTDPADGFGPLSTAMPYLVRVDDIDDILLSRMRDYADLVEQAVEGTGDAAQDRYEFRLDARSYSAAQPVLWKAFEQETIPGVRDDDDLTLTVWIDHDDLLVRLRDEQTHWAWQRLASDVGEPPFTIDVEEVAGLVPGTDATTGGAEPAADGSAGDEPTG